MKKILTTLLLFSLCCGLATASEDDLHYNLINLQAQALSTVDNDLLVVTMTAVAEANTAKEAADSVNETMARAAAMIGEVDTVSYQTLNYQTTPLYKNRAIVGWSVSQQIRLKSGKIEQLTSLVGRLQDLINVSAMQFEIGPERRKETQNRLISEALAAFTEKARLITSALGAKDFRLVSLSINEDGAVPLRREYAMDMALSRSAAPAPDVAAGESQITVTVHGSIQLIF
jgi:predicted secreted protein